MIFLIKPAQQAIISAYEKEFDQWLESFKSSSFEEKMRTILKFTDINFTEITKIRYIIRNSKIHMVLFGKVIYVQHVKLENLFEQFIELLIKTLKELLPTYYTSEKYLEFVKFVLEEKMHISSN